MLTALQARPRQQDVPAQDLELFDGVRRVGVHRDHILITTKLVDEQDESEGLESDIKIAWQAKSTAPAATVESNGVSASAESDRMIQSIVRAHSWLRMLEDGTHATVEHLSDAAGVHSKIVRQELRLAFLSPDITAAILEGRGHWRHHRFRNCSACRGIRTVK